MTALPDNAAPITARETDSYGPIIGFGQVLVEVVSDFILIAEDGEQIGLTLPEARTLLAVLPELIAAMEAGE